MKCRYGEWVDSDESVCTPCKKIAFSETKFYERNVNMFEW